MATTSATSVAVDSTYVAEYDDETDIEEAVTANGDHDLVIKLEPQSDNEDNCDTSWCSAPGPAIFNTTNSYTGGPEDNDQTLTSPSPRRSRKRRKTDKISPSPSLDFHIDIKQEPDHGSQIIFPVRLYRSDNYCFKTEGDLDCHQNGVSQLMRQCPDVDVKVSPDERNSKDQLSCSSEETAKPVIKVNRRKLSSVLRRQPVYHPRTKIKKDTNTDDGESAVNITAVQRSSKPVTKPNKGRRRRTRKQQNIICAECGMTFRWPSRYNEHLRKHSGERPFICRECGDAFTSNSYLRIHERKHNGLLPYPCTLCGEAFLHGRLLTEHRKVHAEMGAFTCGDCGLKCGSPNELSRHRQTEHPDGPSSKPFMCHLCPAAFQRSYHLETHMRSHTGEKPFKCELCGLCYTTQGSLKVHTRSHTGERPFTCPECGRGFITSGQLKKHARTHNKPIVTVSEDKKTVYVQRLKSAHTVTNRDGEGAGLKLEIQCFPKDSTYTCDVCDAVFVRSIDLASHMRHDHPQPARKENMCRECGQVFSRPHTLKIHLRSHAGIRPFKCDTCGKEFAQRSNLSAHLRSHSQFKPFKCTVCGVSYSSAKYREIHMLSHGEIRPCECIVCGSTFSSNSLLSTHVRSHDHSQIAAAFTLSVGCKGSSEAQPLECASVQNGDRVDGSHDFEETASSPKQDSTKQDDSHDFEETDISPKRDSTKQDDSHDFEETDISPKRDSSKRNEAVSRKHPHETDAQAEKETDISPKWDSSEQDEAGSREHPHETDAQAEKDASISKQGAAGSREHLHETDAQAKRDVPTGQSTTGHPINSDDNKSPRHHKKKNADGSEGVCHYVKDTVTSADNCDEVCESSSRTDAGHKSEEEQEKSENISRDQGKEALCDSDN